eukprot:1156601-Pelagomonas_calceolata.AAC.2
MEGAVMRVVASAMSRSWPASTCKKARRHAMIEGISMQCDVESIWSRGITFASTLGYNLYALHAIPYAPQHPAKLQNLGSRSRAKNKRSYMHVPGVYN